MPGATARTAINAENLISTEQIDFAGVLVTANRLQPGQTILPVDVREASYPPFFTPGANFIDSAEVIGRVVATESFEGTLLTPQRLGEFNPDWRNDPRVRNDDPGRTLLPEDVSSARTEAMQCLQVTPDAVGCLRTLALIAYFVDADYNRTIDLLQQTNALDNLTLYEQYLSGRSYFRVRECMRAVENLETVLFQLISDDPPLPETYGGPLTLDAVVTGLNDCGIFPPPEVLR